MTYVFFDPDFEGPNNLRLSLTFALTLARLLNASPARQNAASSAFNYASEPQ